jgi:putative membrane protein insertion efficiency factor
MMGASGHRLKATLCALPLFFTLCIWSFPVSTVAHDGGMRGPDFGPTLLSRSDALPAAIETSPVNLAMQGTIRAYQLAVSRINPDRCGFRPSCSAFGSMAIKEYGAATGILMTADRLMRCNIWKKPGPDYLLLPGGKLLDPPWRNLLAEHSDP